MVSIENLLVDGSKVNPPWGGLKIETLSCSSSNEAYPQVVSKVKPQGVVLDTHSGRDVLDTQILSQHPSLSCNKEYLDTAIIVQLSLGWFQN